jgi:hypothetical protein
MGKSAGTAPTAPDPALVTGLQTQANTTAANQSAALARYNSVGPDENQTWSSTPNFDQAAYDQALKAWNAGNSAPSTFVPGTPATAPNPDYGKPETGQDGSAGSAAGSAGTPGAWQTAAASGSALPAPNMADYTTNQYTLKTTLSPAEQALHDAQQGNQTQQAQLAQALNQKLAGGTGAITTDPGISGYISSLGGLDPNQYNSTAADAAYGAQTSYLDPQVALQQKALQANLADQGFVPGTPGYAQAMQQFQSSTGQQYQAARDAAVTEGATVGNQNFQNQSQTLNSQIAAALQNAGFANTAQNQGTQQLLSELGLTSAGGLGQPYTPAPSQSSTGQTATTDVSNPYNTAYQGQLAGYNAGVSTDNSTTSSLASLAGLAAIYF